MKKIIILALIAGIAMPLSAAKIRGSAILKDVQPTAQTPDKDHKHQAFDLSFPAEGRNYTCRTDPDHSMNATDFVVGETMSYEINGKKVKISTPVNKHVDCTVVRVENAAVPTPY
jgi:hypothetical protein